MPRAETTFRLPESVPVSGLGVETSQVTWLGQSSAETQRAEAIAAGLAVGDGDDVLTLQAGCVATAGALRAFELASRAMVGDVVGRIEGGAASVLDHRAFGPPARLVRLRGGGALTPARLAAAAEVAVPAMASEHALPLLDVSGGRSARVELGPRVVLRMERWPGVLWANLLGLPLALGRELPGPWWLAPLRVVWAAVAARSREPTEVARHLVRCAPGARVHRSASVEGSWLMPGAVVEAGAVVRHSVLGPGAIVEEQGLAIGTVLGPRARIQRRGFATWSVLDADAVVGGSLQLGLVGPAAQLKIGAILLDQHLDGRVCVPDGSGTVEVPLGMLGAALGAQSMVGAGVAIAAGRQVGPGVRIAAGPTMVVVRGTDAAPGSYRVDDGGLRAC